MIRLALFGIITLLQPASCQYRKNKKTYKYYENKYSKGIFRCHTLTSNRKGWTVNKVLPTVEGVEVHTHVHTRVYTHTHTETIHFFHPTLCNGLCNQNLSFVVAEFQRFNLSNSKLSEKCCRNDLFKVIVG